MSKADVIIIGGGLAGLSAAIHLSRAGVKVLLFEKETYPHHKVCGEYLSNEVLPYMDFLDVDILSLQPKAINKLSFSTKRGSSVQTDLPLGGMGISRFALDYFLYQKAVENGVEVIHESIKGVHFYDDFFEVKNEENNSYYAQIVLGAYGKRSNLDKYFDRNFIKHKSSWLAIKAHYEAPDFPDDLVALHNFDGGYCGLSKTETGHVNVCYLATYKSFGLYKNPDYYQEAVLSRNKHLKDFFSTAKPVFEKSLSIAQISFEKKLTSKDHILMLGDAAGLIYPLCGNGMAMAIHSAKLASEAVLDFLQSKDSDLLNLESVYKQNWNHYFKKRMKYGKWLQNMMLQAPIAEASKSLVVAAPFILPKIIKKTHGTPIV